MIRSVNINGNDVEYELEYKNVKNLNLRVRRDGSIYVSANRYVSRQQADAFVIKNGNFILKARARMLVQQECCTGKDGIYEDGDVLYLDGKPYRIRVLEGKKSGADTVGQVLVVVCRNREDPSERKRIIERFLTAFCREKMEILCRQVYPLFAAQGVNWPDIRIRSMVSRWGSCQPRKGVLTFARQLISVPPECQEYVVVHEFTHFLQADHSPAFHARMTQLMPDWKERKKLLNSRKWI